MVVPDTLKEVKDVCDTLKEVMDVPETLKEMTLFAFYSQCYRAQRPKRYGFCRLLISAPTPTILVDFLSPFR
jgi:hypothetical protein